MKNAFSVADLIGMNAATQAVAPRRGDPATTLADMEAAINRIGPEPIGEWMREQGFPPESCLLMLPISMREAFGPTMPDYVRVNHCINAPVLIQDPLAATGRFYAARLAV